MTGVDKTNLSQLNAADVAGFVRVCGPFFEHSPWVSERAAASRPYATLSDLHTALCDAMYGATVEEQINLIASHPDLVGRLAREGRLTQESTSEQAAAGLATLSPTEIEAFERHNATYRAKFGFPFVICARENRKDVIHAAFPVRAANTREQEIRTALGEIAKIARLRIVDSVSEG